MDDTGGAHPSLVVDPADTIHIAYTRNNQLGHAERALSGMAWLTETPDLSPLTSMYGYLSSLAVDQQGDLHVAFITNFNDLHYAYRSPAGAWSTEPIQADNDSTWPEITTDAHADPHVTFRSAGLPNYGRKDPMGGWFTEPSSSTIAFSALDIIVDPSDVIHVVYVDAAQQAEIHHAYRGVGDSAWSDEVVFSEPAGFGINGVALDMDSQNNLHMAFFKLKIVGGQGWVGEAWYAVRNAPGSWTTDLVDNVGPAGAGISLALDREDTAHIGYYVLDMGEVRHARGTLASGWTIETVYDTLGNSGLGGPNQTTIDTDSACGVHIAFHDWENTPTSQYTHLRYGTYCPVVTP